MRLYILRHGETNWNKERRLQGQTDIPLNEEGIRLARLTGEHTMDIPIDYVISSPLGRARKTAELVLNGREVPLHTDKRIIEISFGEWEGKQVDEIRQIAPNFMDDFHNSPMTAAVAPEAETFADVCRRTKDFYEELITKPEYEHANVLISSHGAAGRCLLNNFYEDKIDVWRGCVPANCSICIVDIDVKTKKTNVVAVDKLYA